MKNASDFPGLYDDLFDFANAGYVMIDVSTPLFQGELDLLEEVGYISPDPNKHWMQGLATKWHITARGPLDPKVRQEHCNVVLGGLEFPERLSLGTIEVFPSPYPDENYECVVVLVDDPALFEINQQLAILPGVQTYIPYRPHITVGYFQPGNTDMVRREVYGWLNNYVDVLGVDYGRMKP